MNDRAGDAPRLLHKHSQFAYTSSPAEAMNGEPEAVDAETQRELTQLARQTEQESLRREWSETTSQINRALDRFTAVARLDSGARSSVKAVRRSTSALGRRLGLD